MHQAGLTSIFAAAGLVLTVPATAQQAASVPHTLSYTVPPEAQSTIIIKTWPTALCILRPAEGGAEKSMSRLFADQNGIARFAVRPKAASEAITRLTVNCSTASAETRYDVELRVSAEPNAAYPAPPPVPPPTGRVRPALSAREAERASDQELIKRGYPLPPDPKLSPEGYKLWLGEVTRPGTIVEPGLIKNPYTRHDFGNTRAGTATSNNWSGVELRGSGGPFAWVSSWWVVPNVAGESNAQTNSSTWVGIDGDNTKDLAQAGTEQDAFGTGNMTVATYRAWTELLPNQPTESVLSGLTINPGDQVFTEVWIGSAGGGPSLTAASPFMVVCLENLTSSAGACFNYTPLAGTVVGGSEAEWIMERPSENCGNQGNNCTLSDLANFGNVTVFTTNMLARRSNSPRHGGYSGCCGTGSFLINMTSDGTATGTTLDTVNLNGGTINFDWSAFH
jgi:hypothetical protein